MEKEQGQADEVGADAGATENLEPENEALESELNSRKATIAGLERALAEKDDEITFLKQSVEDARGKLDEMGKALPQAISAYRELLVQANPGLVGEMIKGDSIEEVNESVKSARALVARVRQEVGAENERVRVPAGAPQRMPPDLSTLSPREKIRYAIG